MPDHGESPSPEGTSSADAPNEAAAEEEREGGPASELLASFEKTVGMRVLVYYADAAEIGRWDARPLHQLLKELGRQDQAAIIIQSNGGSAESASLCMSLLREYIDRVHVYVPTYAASAATLFAIGADELWMGPSSELSPIDPQVPVDPRVLIPSADDEQQPFDEPIFIPAHVIRDFLELTGVIESDRKRPKVDTTKLESLLKPLNPWILGWYEHADNNSRILARRALPRLLADVDDDPAERAERIIDELLEGYASHEAGILRGEARRIGIPVKDCPDDAWELLEEISTYYERVLREQSIGRVIETVDGFHALPANPRRTCATCGEATEIRREYLFCPVCGKAFSEVCTNCEGTLRVGWKFCPRCGAEVPLGSGGTASKKAAD